jgi:hypothetical protein
MKKVYKENIDNISITSSWFDNVLWNKVYIKSKALCKNKDLNGDLDRWLYTYSDVWQTYNDEWLVYKLWRMQKHMFNCSTIDYVDNWNENRKRIEFIWIIDKSWGWKNFNWLFKDIPQVEKYKSELKD